MQGIIKWTSVVLFMALLPACAVPGTARNDPMARRVASLVDATTHKATQEQAFTELESLGKEAVPYLVGHLGDERALPVQQISLVNRSPGAFEGLRHYAPEVVHDALSAVLNQITGESFESVYNGSTSAEREVDRERWKDWCVKAYPEKALICRGA